MNVHQNNGGDRRRALTTTVATAIALAVFSLPTAFAQTPAMPKSPVTINITDPAGNLQLTRSAIDEYQKKHPELLAKITIITATAPEVPAKLKAMQAAGRS